MNTPNNPLLAPFDLVPFSKIRNEDFLPAFRTLIEQTKKEINAIADSSEKSSFKNTIEALEFSGEQLERVSSLFFNLNSAETNDEIQKIAQQVSPMLSEFENDIKLNNKLFLRVKAVYDSKESLALDPEQSTLLDHKYKSFARNGANLPDDKKEILRSIDKELSVLKLKFEENVLAETNAYEMHLTDEADLKGLPKGEKEAAAALAAQKGETGWVITLAYPSYIPFLKYAENRELRKKIAIAAGAQGFKANKFNNEENVLKIASLRFQRARLLGYQNHAHFVLEERMAGSPEKVKDFLNDLLGKAKPFAEKEFKGLETFAKELDGID
ncbi:MAG: M3 family metallopeptidase, partial [Bacteroidia bacterium]